MWQELCMETISGWQDVCVAVTTQTRVTQSNLILVSMLQNFDAIEILDYL